MEKRIITVISTRGGRIEKFELDNDLTWGDVKSAISVKYDEIDQLKAVESVGKTTLEHIESVVPNGDIRIFLRPTNTKAGLDFSTMTFYEIREYLAGKQELKIQLNSIAKKIGKNWTQLTTEELRTALTSLHGEDKMDVEEDTSATVQRNLIEHIGMQVKSLVDNFGHCIKEENMSILEDAALSLNMLISNHYENNGVLKLLQEERADIKNEMEKLGFNLDS